MFDMLHNTNVALLKYDQTIVAERTKNIND